MWLLPMASPSAAGTALLQSPLRFFFENGIVAPNYGKDLLRLHDHRHYHYDDYRSGALARWRQLSLSVPVEQTNAPQTAGRFLYAKEIPTQIYQQLNCC